MNTHIQHTDKEGHAKAAAHSTGEKTRNVSAFQFQDNRPEAIAQRKLLAMMQGSSQVNQAAQSQAMANNDLQGHKLPVQKKGNNTGLPDNLKSGIESLSGYPLDDVKVHYNSSQPAQLNAHAYAQGTDIHIAPGQEEHLPHEAWHVVQQKQGRVKPTMQMMGKVNINDNAGLENEADVMGAKAMQFSKKTTAPHPTSNKSIQGESSQSQKKTVQRIMKKLNVEKEQYRKMTMSTVYLFAQFDGKDLGVFSTKKGGHAEENLIQYIIEHDLRDGNLVVYLSTSPCSSTFCTREDGKEGCQERLERLKSERNIIVTVHADHLYQPQSLGSLEVEQGGKGYSSYSSASTSTFHMDFSSLPKNYYTSSMMDTSGEKVAQLSGKDGKWSAENDLSAFTTISG